VNCVSVHILPRREKGSTGHAARPAPKQPEAEQSQARNRRGLCGFGNEGEGNGVQVDDRRQRGDDATRAKTEVCNDQILADVPRGAYPVVAAIIVMGSESKPGQSARTFSCSGDTVRIIPISPRNNLFHFHGKRAVRHNLFSHEKHRACPRHSHRKRDKANRYKPRNALSASAISRPLASMKAISSSGVRVSTSGLRCGFTALRS